jgi:hypothetical protein
MIQTIINIILGLVSIIFKELELSLTRLKASPIEATTKKKLTPIKDAHEVFN